MRLLTLDIEIGIGGRSVWFRPRWNGEMHKIYEDICALTERERDLFLSLLDELDEVFTDKPGCASLMQYSRGTDDALS